MSENSEVFRRISGSLSALVLTKRHIQNQSAASSQSPDGYAPLRQMPSPAVMRGLFRLLPLDQNTRIFLAEN